MNAQQQQQQEQQQHEYDGIIEHDNRLPRWWLATLWSAIAFGFAYWMFYETLGIGDTPREELAQQLEKKKAEEAAVAFASSVVASAELDAGPADAATVERGRVLYVSTCQACHADQGQGLVGPNLTDNAWIHGSAPSDILKVVMNGVPAQGMPAWGPALGPDKVKDVVAFVLTLKGKNVPGKAPQGAPGT